MNPTSKFTANEQNLGGRNAIRRQLLEHHNAILYAKPTMDTREKPRQHVDAKLDRKKKVAKGQNAFEFNEVYHSFKKVSECKGGYVDNKKPETYDIGKKAVPQNKRATDHAQREHELNLKAQRRRIDGIGKTMTDRKKNPYDPVAYPSVFFRRPEQSKKDLTVDFMFNANTGVGRSTTTGFNLTKMKNKLEKRPISSYDPNRPSYDLENISPIKGNMSGMLDKGEEVPDFVGNPKDDEAYHDYKLKVIDHIIEHRLYKAMDLEVLKERIKIAHQKLNRDKLEDMFEQINIELDR